MEFSCIFCKVEDIKIVVDIVQREVMRKWNERERY